MSNETKTEEQKTLDSILAQVIEKHGKKTVPPTEKVAEAEGEQSTEVEDSTENKEPNEESQEVNPKEVNSKEEQPTEDDPVAKWKKFSRHNEARALAAYAERDSLKAELEQLKSGNNVFTASEVESLLNEKLEEERKNLAKQTAKTLLVNELSGFEKIEDVIGSVNVETFLTEKAEVDLEKIRSFASLIAKPKEEEKKSSTPSWGQTFKKESSTGKIWGSLKDLEN